jgi:hypothetical protein
MAKCGYGSACFSIASSIAGDFLILIQPQCFIEITYTNAIRSKALLTLSFGRPAERAVDKKKVQPPSEALARTDSWRRPTISAATRCRPVIAAIIIRHFEHRGAAP